MIWKCNISFAFKEIVTRIELYAIENLECIVLEIDVSKINALYIEIRVYLQGYNNIIYGFVWFLYVVTGYYPVSSI